MSCQSAKIIGITVIHSHGTAIVALAVVILPSDTVREKRPAPLTEQSGMAGFKNPCSAPGGYRCPGLSRKNVYEG